MSVSSSESYTDITGRETKAHGRAGFPAACYCLEYPGANVGVHWHSELELILIEEGQVRLYAASERYVLTEGMGAFVNANILHTTEPDDRKRKVKLHSIVFSPRMVGGSDDSVCWTKYLLPLINDASCPIRIFTDDNGWQKETLLRIRKAWEAIAADSHGYEFVVRNELSLIILALCDHQSHSVRPISGRVLRNEARMKLMLNYIGEHFSENILLEDIAKAASISKSECIRCFKDILDITPMQYTARYRLQTAAGHLLCTDWQISEIGYRCGFTDMGYFAAQFKRRYGMTPSVYRTMHCADSENGSRIKEEE